MSEKAPILMLEDGLLALGAGAEGDTLVFESTGVTLGGLTVFRLVPAASVAGAEILVDDASGEILIDDSGAVLYDG